MRNLVYSWVVILAFLSCQTKSDFKIETVDFLKLEESYLEVVTVADSLDVPWGMAFFDGSLIFTEIKGRVKKLDLENGEVSTLLSLDSVFHQRTPGLLDIAVQKNEKKEPYVLLNYTTREGKEITSNLVRYTLHSDTLLDPLVLLKVKGSTGHNGSRILIDDRDVVYWATGDAQDNDQPQDSTTLNGKILRLNLDGSIPKDNPIADSYVYAWGFRNMQGLTRDKSGNIFTSEHGDAIEDEVNLIKPLRNYGWPLVEGMVDTESEISKTKELEIEEPVRSWTPVIAPAGLSYYGSQAIPEWENSLLLVTLKGQSLRVLTLGENNTAITDEKVFFSKRYGRMRDVLTAPNGDVYISTSNQDWNPQPGFPLAGDDRILRIRKINSSPQEYIEEDVQSDTLALDGALLYKNFCSSCHKDNGMGVPGNFPPLKNSKMVKEPSRFIDILLHGTDGKQPIDGVMYNEPMASFSFLKDEELSAIANYVNSKFGDGNHISPEEIKKNR